MVPYGRYETILTLSSRGTTRVLQRYHASDIINIPFFWCQKKICVRRAHFLKPSTKWEEYRFADLLFIAMGQKSELRDPVWRINAEISQFICDYTIILKSNERDICSAPLNESNEIGIWDNESTTFRDIYDDYVEYYDEEDYSPDFETPTYDRFNGPYAKDEMGYSDDDIDTIFDGDPSAYWNID